MKTFTLLTVIGAVSSVGLAIYGVWMRSGHGKKTNMTNYVAAAIIFTAIMATLAVNLK